MSYPPPGDAYGGECPLHGPYAGLSCMKCGIEALNRKRRALAFGAVVALTLLAAGVLCYLYS